MKNIAVLFFILVINFASSAQETPVYKKNGVSLNVTQVLINELAFSYERFLSVRRSIELTAGMIYVNEGLKELAKDWTNSQVFYEQGFSLRLGYKIYKKGFESSKWKDYVEPILIYKYLYYENQWFESPYTDENTGAKYTERFYQHRFRNEFGLDFLWGKVYQFNKSFSLELFYGAGIRATSASRHVILQQDTTNSSPIYQVDDDYDSFYFRPMLTGGAKLKISF